MWSDLMGPLWQGIVDGFAGVVGSWWALVIWQAAVVLVRLAICAISLGAILYARRLLRNRQASEVERIESGRNGLLALAGMNRLEFAYDCRVIAVVSIIVAVLTVTVPIPVRLSVQAYVVIIPFALIVILLMLYRMIERQELTDRAMERYVTRRMAEEQA